MKLIQYFALNFFVKSILSVSGNFTPKRIKFFKWCSKLTMPSLILRNNQKNRNFISNTKINITTSPLLTLNHHSKKIIKNLLYKSKVLKRNQFSNLFPIILYKELNLKEDFSKGVYLPKRHHKRKPHLLSRDRSFISIIWVKPEEVNKESITQRKNSPKNKIKKVPF